VTPPRIDPGTVVDSKLPINLKYHSFPVYIYVNVFLCVFRLRTLDILKAY
jgi:hypothetical protein